MVSVTSLLSTWCNDTHLASSLQVLLLLWNMKRVSQKIAIAPFLKCVCIHLLRNHFYMWATASETALKVQSFKHSLTQILIIATVYFRNLFMIYGVLLDLWHLCVHLLVTVVLEALICTYVTRQCIFHPGIFRSVATSADDISPSAINNSDDSDTLYM